MKYTLDYQKYAELARRVAAEGSVLLRNEEDTLPLRRGQRVLSKLQDAIIRRNNALFRG